MILVDLNVGDGTILRVYDVREYGTYSSMVLSRRKR